MNKLIVASCIGFLMFSCKSEETDAKKTVDIQTEKDTVPSEPMHEIVYAVPSPSEQHDLLYMLGGEVNPAYTNPLSRMSEYTTPEAKALNFGVYLSDAAYMMRFKQGKKVFLDYVSSLDKMGNELDISQVYGKDLIKEVEEAGGDAEKLFELSSRNYLEVFDQMIEKDKGKELSLILSGAWIETMYILFESSGKFNEHLEIQTSITEQRAVLENLIAFVSEFNEHESVKEIQGKLEKILAKYDDLDCEETQARLEDKGDNSFVLHGGTSCVFTKESYKEMKDLIRETRKSIVL